MASGAYEFHYGSWTDTTGASNFVRAYIYHKETWANDKLNMHWWAGINVKSNYTTNAKFTMTTSATNASNRSATVDNMGYTGGSHAIIKDVDYNWPKKTTAYNVTVTATLKPYGKSASTVSITYTVPALTKYTISFNSNGGTSCASQTNYYSYSIILPTPSRTGYKFKGWATTNGGAVSYNGGASYTVTANATLYAVWGVTYTAPTLQGNVIGYRTSTDTLPTYPNKPEEDDEGTYAYVQFNTNAGTNVDYSATYSAAYISNNGSSTSFNLQRHTNSDNTYTYYGIIKPTGGFDIGTAYNIKVQVTNKSTSATGGVNLITVATFNLSKQIYAIDISADSKRVAFGASASDNSNPSNPRSDFGIEVAGSIEATGDISTTGNMRVANNLTLKNSNVVDFVIDQGTTTGTNQEEFYRIWKSGKKEIWGYKDMDGNSMTAFGSSTGLYTKALTLTIAKTGFFVYRDSAQFMIRTTGGSGYATIWSGYAATNVNQFTLRLVGTAAAAGTVRIDYHIIGR